MCATRAAEKRRHGSLVAKGLQSRSCPADGRRRDKRISTTDTQRTHWPALDGIRGVAILLVVGFHLAPTVVVAGSWGVSLFFVLSGFLITTILCHEKDRFGRIGLRRFLWRRAVRILPALTVVVVFYLVVAGPWSMAWPTAVFVANIPLAMGGTVGLGHTWSLAVEEHFYLLWPLAIIVVPASRRFWTVATLTTMAVVWRCVVLLETHTWERVYYSTDTNAFALLAGCLLSVLVLDGRLNPARGSVWPLALVIAAAIAPAFVTTSDLYLWATFPVVLLSALAIHQGLTGSRFLEYRWLRWLGKVSYGLYLWHNILIHLPWPGPDMVVGALMSVVVTWLSWKAVELPALRLKGRLQRPGRHHEPSQVLAQ